MLLIVWLLPLTPVYGNDTLIILMAKSLLAHARTVTSDVSLSLGDSVAFGCFCTPIKKRLSSRYEEHPVISFRKWATAAAELRLFSSSQINWKKSLHSGKKRPGPQGFWVYFLSGPPQKVDPQGVNPLYHQRLVFLNLQAPGPLECSSNRAWVFAPVINENF